jgi:predicted nucleic acid-binding protein
VIYADTSFFLATLLPRDTFNRVALPYYESRQDDVWLWSPWHRVEVFNSLRQLTRHPDSQRRLSEDEANALIRNLENDVRLGYFTHMEVDWRDILRTANEISIAHGFSLACRSADLLHVSYSTELAAEEFISFDDDQLKLAQAVGIKAIRPS